MKHVPNILGIARVIGAAPLYWLISIAQPWADATAAAVLLLMAASDIVDGWLARRLGVVSPLGVFLDTISDKIFVVAALVPLAERGLFPGWMVTAILIREFAVSGLRAYAGSAGVVIAAGSWGKQKQTLIVAALVWCLVAAALGPADPAWLATIASIWPGVLWLALLWTVGSGIEYFFGARALLLGRGGTS